MAQASTLYPPSYEADCPQPVHHFNIQQQPLAPIHQSQPVVILQPSPIMSNRPPPDPVPDYMCYSRFTTACCCICLGLVAYYFSKETRRANAAGLRAEAAKNSQTALIWNHIALVVGIILGVFYFLYKFYYEKNDF